MREGGGVGRVWGTLFGRERRREEGRVLVHCETFIWRDGFSCKDKLINKKTKLPQIQ